MGPSLLALLIIIGVRVYGEVEEIRRRQPRRERTITHNRYIDGWIVGRYPQRYVREYNDEAGPKDERWYPFLRGEPTTAAVRDALVIDGAFQLEFRARRMFAGAQFKGILEGRLSLVWARDPAIELRQLLDAHEPGPEARACLDRALGWWRTALARGMRIFEWDRPGYDEVTTAFQDLASLAREVVSVDPAAHGVEIETKTRTIPAQVLGRPYWPILRIIGLLLIALVCTCAVLSLDGDSRRDAPVRAHEPLNCGEQRAKVLRASEVLSGELPPGSELAAALAEAVAAVQAGDSAAAFASWNHVHDDRPASILLNADLLLLRYCGQ